MGRKRFGRVRMQMSEVGTDKSVSETAMYGMG
jgi:hypothetical protein